MIVSDCYFYLHNSEISSSLLSSLCTLIRISIGTCALNKFCDDNTTAVVPVNRINSKGITNGEELQEGNRCTVKWSNQKILQSIFYFGGNNVL